MRVTSGDGVWHVRRRWAPRHLGSETIWARFRNRTRRVRRDAGDLADVPDPGCGIDIAESIAVFLLVVVLVVFLVFIGIPILIALGELVFVLFLTVAGVVGRVLFRRPWMIDAVGPRGEHYTWAVVGWRASGVARQLVADHLDTFGRVPTPEEVSSATT